MVKIQKPLEEKQVLHLLATRSASLGCGLAAICPHTLQGTHTSKKASSHFLQPAEVSPGGNEGGRRGNGGVVASQPGATASARSLGQVPPLSTGGRAVRVQSRIRISGRSGGGTRSPCYTPMGFPHPLGLPWNLHGSILRNLYPYLKVTFQGEVGSLHAHLVFRISLCFRWL